MLRTFFTLLTLLIGVTCFAQLFPEHILDGLNARQSGNDMEVTWVMSRGVQCVGIDVERSLNGGPFERVYRIGGICGSNEQPEPYRFTDAQLAQGGTYVYHLSFGNIGEARTTQTFQAVWESGVSVLPQGGSHVLRVEGFNGTFDIGVYSLSGAAVFQQSNVFSPSVKLPSAGWPQGIYVVVVSNGQTAKREKFAIIR